MTDRHIKDTSGYCPHCDTIDKVITPDVEFISGDYIIIHHRCGNCGAEWDEYYYVQYTGYSQGNVDYDCNGYTEEENKAFEKMEVEFATFCQETNCEECSYANAVSCRIAYYNDHDMTTPDFSNYPDPEEVID